MLNFNLTFELQLFHLNYRHTACFPTKIISSLTSAWCMLEYKRVKKKYASRASQRAECIVCLFVCLISILKHHLYFYDDTVFLFYFFLPSFFRARPRAHQYFNRGIVTQYSLAFTAILWPCAKSISLPPCRFLLIKAPGVLFDILVIFFKLVLSFQSKKS